MSCGGDRRRHVLASLAAANGGLSLSNEAVRQGLVPPNEVEQGEERCSLLQYKCES